jgi:pimeloyl-ACP methyl ester carboxylesterase
MAIQKAYVTVGDGQIHCRMSPGAGAALPLVFLHQTASSSQSYENIMSRLEGEFTMIALDTPGFGQSFFPPQHASTAYYVATLLEALANLGVVRFHAFGHHTGASIAVEMGATAPERVASLMLEGPVWLSEAERKYWLDTAIDPMVIQADGSHLMKIWDRVVGLDPYHPPEICHREALDTLRAGERWHEAYIAVFSQDSYAMFSRVQCPMLLLCGKNDVLMPYFKPVCEAFPHARAAVLPGCGVYALDQCAEEIAAEIRGFVKGLDHP